MSFPLHRVVSLRIDILDVAPSFTTAFISTPVSSSHGVSGKNLKQNTLFHREIYKPMLRLVEWSFSHPIFSNNCCDWKFEVYFLSIPTSYIF